ncbi:MAG: GNAT family N-acetyltransferase, partial [Sciscionella sp.]
MQIVLARYDHPEATRLTEQLQQVYLRLYGEVDDTPVDPAQFAPPHGVFLLGYSDGADAGRKARSVVGSGGWRARSAGRRGVRDGDAEIKRMFVLPEVRGNGYARLLLAELERTAAAAGRDRMILE